MEFNPLADNTVVSFSPAMFKVGELTTTAVEIFSSTGYEELHNELKSLGKGQMPSNQGYSFFDNGINCEVLIPTDANGWQKGKVRMKVILEFCPDEPEVEEELPKAPPIAYEEVLECAEEIKESPLDDIRRQINNSN